MIRLADRRRLIVLIASVVLAALVGLEALALLEEAAFPYYQTTNGSGFRHLSLGLFWLLAPLSPGLFLLLIYSPPASILFELMGRHIRKLSRLNAWLAKPFNSFLHWTSREPSQTGLPNWKNLALFILALASGTLTAFTPYRPDLNPQGTLVGVDAQEYVTWVGGMIGRNPIDALGYAFVGAVSGSRPIPLILLYTLANLPGMNLEAAVRLAPVILAPIFVAASFLFVMVGLHDAKAASVTALFSAFSYQVTVGVWAGYYSNWLGLVESYVALAGFLAFARSKSKASLLVLLIASLTLLFTHPWTWVVFLLVMTALVLDNLLHRRRLELTRLMLFVIGANIVADVLKTFAIGAYSGDRAGFDIAAQASVYAPLSLWPNTAGAFTRYYDGNLANAVYLGLAFLAIMSLYRSTDLFSRVLIVWVTVTSIPFLFLDSLLQSRLVFITPVAICATIGMVRLMDRFSPRRWQNALLLSFVVLFAVTEALDAMLRLVSI